MPSRWKLFIFITLLSLVLDQASKYWARNSLPKEGPDCSEIPAKIEQHKCFGKPVPVIDGYWDWRLSMNPGSAFGLFNTLPGGRALLTLVGVIAVLAIGVMVRRAKDHQRWLILALALVAGGAVGNLIDRVYFGVVTDFVLWRYKEHEWPVFNVADVVLVIGVAILILDLGKDNKKGKTPAKPAAA